MHILRLFLAATAIASTLGLSACGGGGGGSSAPPAASSTPTPAAPAAAPAPASASDANVVPITIDSGTTGQAFNSAFVTVTVCVPGATACQQIDHVLLDTGSFGLRIAASA